MNRRVQEFLKRLQAVIGQLNLYPANHPNSQTALRNGWKAANDLAGDGKTMWSSG